MVANKNCLKSIKGEFYNEGGTYISRNKTWLRRQIQVNSVKHNQGGAYSLRCKTKLRLQIQLKVFKMANVVLAAEGAQCN